MARKGGVVRVSRRDVLRGGAAGALALGLGGLTPTTLRALAAAPRCASLTDIEHVVIIIQENRSFDHWFGTYPGVRGYSDPSVLANPDGSGRSIFAQRGWAQPGYGGYLLPYHSDSTRGAACTNDITHDWGPQHRSWNAGAMDRFLAEHLAADGSQATAALTMSYYTRADLDYYYALADAFTICDRYHCSVMGPTETNRFFSMSATNDPAGTHGGPVVNNLSNNATYTWTTMPEQLQARGITWKFYSQPTGTTSDNVLYGFKQYFTDPTLFANGIAPTYPGTFEADVAAGMLPQVTWITNANGFDEHPNSAPSYGEWSTSQVLNTLTADPALWAKTVVFLTYDENGGFFDHVPPPTAPPGTPGEYLTVSPLPAAAEGIAGPIGLGFRVPMLVISPFSRGGLVCSDVFDHTSLLRFLETRFGAEVPNLSAWRRSVTGDLTSALNLTAPDTSFPALPATAITPYAECSNPGSFPDVPVPANSTPAQEPGARRRSGGLSCAAPPASVPDVPWPALLGLAGPAAALLARRAKGHGPVGERARQDA